VEAAEAWPKALPPAVATLLLSLCQRVWLMEYHPTCGFTAVEGIPRRSQQATATAKADAHTLISMPYLTLGRTHDHIGAEPYNTFYQAVVGRSRCKHNAQ